MGRALIIIVVLVATIFTGIMLTVRERSSEIPTILTANEKENSAENLGAYALEYAIKQVKDEAVTSDSLETFSNFKVLNGKINFIKYDFKYGGVDNVIQIDANVTWGTAPDTVNHNSIARLQFSYSDDPIIPIGHWEFFEGSGANAHDTSGNANDGTFVNKPNADNDWTTDRFENNNQAMGFNGTFGPNEDYLSVNDAPSLDAMESGTVDAWVYLEHYIPFGGIIHKGEKADWTDEAYSLQFWTTGKEACFAVRNNANQVQVVVGPQNLKLYRWYHILGVWNPNEVSVWVNGEKVASEPNNIGAVRNSSGDLQIGSQLSVGNVHSYYNSTFGVNGVIDDARVVNYDVSEEDIKKDYIKSSMIAHWKFDEDSGDQALDSSKNNHTGTLYDAYAANGYNLPQRVSGKYDKALKFNGNDNMVTVPSSEAFHLKNGGSITMWVNPTNYVNNAFLINKPGKVLWRDIDIFGIYLENGKKPNFILTSIFKWIAKSNYTLPKNNWTFISATNYRRFSDFKWIQKIYINSKLKDQNFSGLLSHKSNENLNIGARTTQYTSSNHCYGFDGIIDDVRIFFRELRDDEVKTINEFTKDDVTPQKRYRIIYWKE